MITKICNQSFKSSHVFKNIFLVFVVNLFLLDPANLLSQESPVSSEDKLYKQTKIAFTSEIDENFDIYVMNLDGSEQKRLTYNPDWDEQPSWSPDGTQIAYMSIVDDGKKGRHWEVFVMNADGGDQRRLTHRSGASPSWSPDGEKIAFQSKRRKSGNYIMNSDGSQQEKLTSRGYRPSWSGDGKQIVYISWATNKSTDIWVINADGTGDRNLTNSAAMDGTPKFSPDGSKIAFLSIVDENYDIYVVNVDGTELKRLTHNTDVDIGPSWSPDGKKIIFERGQENESEIFIMNADGSEQKRLTNNSVYDGHPSWSPFLKTEE